MNLFNEASFFFLFFPFVFLLFSVCIFVINCTSTVPLLQLGFFIMSQIALCAFFMGTHFSRRHIKKPICALISFKT